jgi:hypothetical protein
MLKKIIMLAMVAVLAALLVPSKVDAWGAARVSATRVGPYGGVYHGSRTVAGGYGGGYRAGYGGVGYRGGYGYSYGYGGVAAGGFRYGYIR